MTDVLSLIEEDGREREAEAAQEPPRMPQEPTEDPTAGEETPEMARTIPCPECKGKGGWMHAEYESGGACVGQSFEDCPKCETTGRVPKPKPPEPVRDTFKCPDHPDQMTTLHIAVPTGGYRRACFLCPPIEPITLVKECNKARAKREKERKRGKRK